MKQENYISLRQSNFIWGTIGIGDRFKRIFLWLYDTRKKHKNWCFHLEIILQKSDIIRFGSKLYRQNVGIPMGTNCGPLVADLFLFCYERDFMKSPTKEKRYGLIDAFNSTLDT